MYALGYDVGSSFVKAAIVDVERGKVVASVSFPDTEMPIHSPAAGWAEQDPETWWNAVAGATRVAASRASISLHDIRAIGISYQMHGLVLVDKDGQVLRPSIIWCDSRATEIGRRAFAEIGESVCLKEMLNTPGNFTASKLRWVKEHEPAVYEKAYKLLLPGEYIALRLTGECKTLSAPPVEVIAGPEKVNDLAQLANDEMAELVSKYPDRFVTAVACLPMNSIENALKEADRAINDLKFKGVQIYTPINDKPLDSPEFIPLYEKMSKYDLPIWIHPYSTPMYADYRTENTSKYDIWMIFGWPYQTAAAMTRLVMSGILERYPNLKFITHHCGNMLPFFAQRLEDTYDEDELLMKENCKEGLSRPPIEYFKMFYNDTALYGNTPALMCTYFFCGADHLLFGTDMPYDCEIGDKSNRETIRAIEQMNISSAEKNKIFEDNARQLLRL